MISMTHPLESAAAVVIAVLATFVALKFLESFKRRNDLLVRFQAFERDQETRMLACEKAASRFGNLLASHEKLVTMVARNSDETKVALTDLATKWLNEVADIRTTQTAAFTQGVRPPRRGFSP